MPGRRREQPGAIYSLMCTWRSCGSRWSVQESDGSRDSSAVALPLPEQKTVRAVEGNEAQNHSCLQAGDEKLERPAIHSRKTMACRSPRGPQQTRGDRVQCPLGTGPGTGVVPMAEPGEKGEPACHSQHEPEREHRFLSGSSHLKRGPHVTCRLCFRTPHQAGGPACPLDGRKKWTEDVLGRAQGQSCPCYENHTQKLKPRWEVSP